MEFLTKNQKRLLMTGDGKLESNWDGGFISAEGKDVIVIGVSAPSSVLVVRPLCLRTGILWAKKKAACYVHVGSKQVW